MRSPTASSRCSSSPQGMSLDVRSIAEAPLRLLMFFVLLLLVRGCRLIAVRRGSAIVFPTAGPTARFCEKGGRVIAGAAGGPLATGGVERDPLDGRPHPSAVDHGRSASGASAGAAPLTPARSGDLR